MIDIKVQRFDPGHPLYSDAKDKAGLQSTFGQIVDENGKLISYCLERRDKLIPLGTYRYTFTYSEVNKCIVPILIGVPGRAAIEIHIADFNYELLGCTAPGSTINKSVPCVAGSEIAWCTLISLIIGQPFKRWEDEKLKPFIGVDMGAITYETLNQNV
jgi:hypothetical protein